MAQHRIPKATHFRQALQWLLIRDSIAVAACLSYIFQASVREFAIVARGRNSRVGAATEWLSPGNHGVPIGRLATK